MCFLVSFLLCDLFQNFGSLACGQHESPAGYGADLSALDTVDRVVPGVGIAEHNPVAAVRTGDLEKDHGIYALLGVPVEYFVGACHQLLSWEIGHHTSRSSGETSSLSRGFGATMGQRPVKNRSRLTSRSRVRRIISRIDWRSYRIQRRALFTV